MENTDITPALEAARIAAGSRALQGDLEQAIEDLGSPAVFLVPGAHLARRYEVRRYRASASSRAGAAHGRAAADRADLGQTPIATTRRALGA